MSEQIVLDDALCAALASAGEAVVLDAGSALPFDAGVVYVVDGELRERSGPRR